MTRGVFVLQLLVEAVLSVCFAATMPLRKAVECLDTAAFVYPFALTGGGTLLGLLHQGLRLQDGFVEPAEEGLVVAPGIPTDAVFGGCEKALMVFITVLLEQDDALSRFLFSSQKLPESARGVIHV